MGSPEVIMFVRHAEKPADPGPPHGINHHGEHDAHSLSVRGWTRAGALAALFSHLPSPSHPHLVTPARVIATKASHGYASKREVDTATPAARRLGVPVDEHFSHDEVSALCESLMSDPRPTLVVWHHGSITDVLKQLPIANRGDVPAAWPDDRFDLIWVLVRAADESQYRFVVDMQGLLDGDALPA